jgi:hypothetical protein
MIISKVRDYFRAQILAIDSDFYEWDNPFDSDNIPETLADKAYFLKYSIDSVTEQSDIIEQNVSVDIEFFYKTYNSRVETYDNAMNQVNAIMLKAILVQTIETFHSTDDNPIFRVEFNSQVPTQLDSNDNQLKISLSFTCGINLGKCE